MDKIIAIDYGDSKVGIAVSSGVLASPLKTIRYKNTNELLAKLGNIFVDEKPAKFIVGISENKSAEKSRDFGNKLSEFLGLPVEFVDETLSTKDAQRLSIESGMNRNKRRNMEDAFAAALILQKYLDDS